MRTLDQIYMYQGSGNDVTLPVLYQRDSKGKVRQWSVRTEGSTIIVEHGIVDGKMQQQRTTAKPKNVGKVNETTAEEQAVIEAKALHVKQIERKDYNEDVEKAGLQTRAMLALDYRKVPHRVRWDFALVQPKLNGHRLTCGFRYSNSYDIPGGKQPVFELLTRKGETRDSLQHIKGPAEDLLTICAHFCAERGLPTPYAIDGETYKPGWTLNFIESRSKKYYPGETEQLQFHVFDILIKGVPFACRYEILKEALETLHNMGTGKELVLVECYEVSNEEEMLRLHGEFLVQLYEGIIIRHRDGKYLHGPSRSPDLFKYKEFFDEETRIIDVWEDQNGNAMFTCVRRNGVEVKVTPKRTHEERKEMLLHPEEWIGKWITTQYQSETTDGSLEFPVGLDIREVDEEGEPIV